MPDPYPDGARPRPPAHTGVAPPPRRRRPLLPLLLATVLTVVVVLAAMRGEGDTPTLVSSSEVSDQTGAGSGPDAVVDEPPSGAGPTTPEEDDTGVEGAEVGGDAGLDEDAEVLGTAATPTTTPAATRTVRVEDLPTSGSGEFISAPPAPEPYGAEPYRRFAVAVEAGIDIEAGELAAFVDMVLSDGRSWIGDGQTGFRRVGAGEAVDFTIVVATPATVDRLCAPLQTAGRYSCATNGWVALNLHRWMTATPEWPASLETYRHYLVNHEVGHYILGPDHPGCPEPGALAPIMMQQTIDLAGCRPNGWVFPRRS